MIAPPNRIRVGAFDYEIRYFDAIESDSRRADGYVDYQSKTIGVCMARDRFSEAVSFFEEIFHAIHHERGLRDGDSEEDFAERTALGFVGFLRDNPDAWKWIGSLVHDDDGHAPIRESIIREMCGRENGVKARIEEINVEDGR